MRICKTFKSVTICSAIVSVTAFFIGVTLSYVFAIPTGACVVLVHIFVFLLFWALGMMRQVKVKAV
jgi:zinc transport system permease protein